MSLELAVELRRLKAAEDRLKILEREATELTGAMIADTADGAPTGTLRLLMMTNQADVRKALEDWMTSKHRISDMLDEPQLERRKRVTG